MVLQRTYGAILNVILVGMVTSLFLVGCGYRPPEPEIKVVTKVEKTVVPVVERPKPVNLTDTRIYVVNEDNFESFKEEFKELNGDLAFVALSIRDYENLALNVAELRRYINQQTKIILYYEEAVTDNGDKDESENRTKNGQSE